MKTSYEEKIEKTSVYEELHKSFPQIRKINRLDLLNSLVKTLYIVGNGFDLSLGFQTRYANFEKELKSSNKKLYNALTSCFILKSDDDWNHFEEKLGELPFLGKFPSKNGIDEKLINTYYNFNNKAINDHHFEQGNLLNIVSSELNNEVALWISKAYSNKDNLNTQNIESIKAIISSAAWFLTFNYTLTLEEIFNIDPRNVFHVNGVINGATQFNLPFTGFGDNPEFVRKKFVKETQNGRILKDKLDLSDHMISDEVLVQIKNYLFKQSKASRLENSNYYLDIALNKIPKDISEIVILGHSIAPCDHVFFEKLKEIINNYPVKPKWYISYHDEITEDFKDKLVKFMILMSIDISDICLFRF